MSSAARGFGWRDHAPRPAHGLAAAPPARRPPRARPPGPPALAVRVRRRRRRAASVRDPAAAVRARAACHRRCRGCGRSSSTRRWRSGRRACACWAEATRSSTRARPSSCRGRGSGPPTGSGPTARWPPWGRPEAGRGPGAGPAGRRPHLRRDRGGDRVEPHQGQPRIDRGPGGVPHAGVRARGGRRVRPPRLAAPFPGPGAERRPPLLWAYAPTCAVRRVPGAPGRAALVHVQRRGDRLRVDPIRRRRRRAHRRGAIVVARREVGERRTPIIHERSAHPRAQAVGLDEHIGAGTMPMQRPPRQP